ncbi:MAG: hypothetical protein COS76_00700 [Candidatus Portnoybacteria bacterium CG06_land_8_20_14_3_00_39_12]|uniref:Antitoxin n=3 Tax=Candidatus Portnoyibacteriota TaxID=1817913 RepID=A0A2M8KGS9_9BACT|nr:MAG: hypothetical protein AUJ33_01560 [Parcubacteria group bacterium CG1_02_40_25]PIU75440.1 MAG: hypothetical protein COS76_00700 [Candidatus Portnoybacteria bacterium CG06_land_8_20_14_3_00_39_12]PIZ70469.1 MAG: hypothetical protein COY09_02930 [Candidatus Portnoybacteria bacterium CG_4_10_14_0_2_um_filter_39_11]PJE59128.1 MAG: hypothetical protein COU83_00285 [Candidatus Portnoybacteria bacterium CG10_big_fil_rev_8_21_14_0_10_40_22]
MKNYKLNKYEQEILDAFEAGKLKSIKNEEKKNKEYMLAAKDSLNKTKNINIRISNGDLQKIKAKAVEKGLPYQTLIGSLLHQHFAEASKELTK